jgi:hypothetical protein
MAFCDKINWNIKTYKLKLLILLKGFVVYYYCLLELLLSCIPPRSLLHPCHYPRGTSIRWIVDTSIFELCISIHNMTLKYFICSNMK